MSGRGAWPASATAVALFLSCLSGAAAAASAPIARPDPVLVNVNLDYVEPLHEPSGASAALVPLDPVVAKQAVEDERYLHYRSHDDLGGFQLAPIGESPLSSGGREVVGTGNNTSQIPQYGQTAEGVVRSFAFLGASSGGVPENGRTPIRGIGIPPQLPLPSNTNALPPPNQGFGGSPVNRGGGSGREEGASSNPPPSKQPHGGKQPSSGKQQPPSGSHPPPTGASGEGGQTAEGGRSSGNGQSGGGEPPVGASCGTAGLEITSDHSTCRIYAVNMAPGQSASEVMTIRNEAGVPVTLSLRAGGEENRFWNDLRMGVWPVGAAAPEPLPELLWWTTQENRLSTLQAGQAISYEIELYLPSSAGNEDQGQAAVIDFTWHAQQ